MKLDGLGPEDYRTFKYFAGFVREWTRLGLDDDDLRELELQIISNPEAGNLIPGTGGLRKLRFSPSRWKRGKSGALRIGYAHDGTRALVLVTTAYAKNDKSNLTPRERLDIKHALERFWHQEKK